MDLSYISISAKIGKQVAFVLLCHFAAPTSILASIVVLLYLTIIMDLLLPFHMSTWGYLLTSKLIMVSVSVIKLLF